MSKVYEYYLAMQELEKEEEWNEMHMMTEQDIDDMYDEYVYNQYQQEIA